MVLLLLLLLLLRFLQHSVHRKVPGMPQQQHSLRGSNDEAPACAAAQEATPTLYIHPTNNYRGFRV